MTRLARDDRALDELEDIGQYIAADSPRAAVRVVEHIREKARLLQDFPAVGRGTPAEGVRDLVLTRYPYILVYALEGEEVRILSVVHQRRDRT